MGERSEPIAALLSLITSLPDIAEQVERLQTTIDRSATENRKRHDETLSLVRSSLAKVSSLEKRIDGIEKNLHHVNETCDAILDMCRRAGNDDQDMSSDEDEEDAGEEEEDRMDDEDENMEEGQDGQETDARLGPGMQGALSRLQVPGGIQGSSGLLTAFREFLATKWAQGEGSESERGAPSSNTHPSPNANSFRRSASQVGTEQSDALLSALAQSLTPAQLISNANGNATQDTRRNASRRLTQDRDAIAPGRSDRDYSEYRLDRKIRTVHLLWKEWYEGLDDDKPSIVTMDSLYKHTWRSSARERKYFAHRKVIVDEIHAIMRVRNWTSKTAVDYLDGIKGRNSLLKLSEALKMQKKAGIAAGHLADLGSEILTQLDEERQGIANEGDEDQEGSGEDEAEED